MAVYKHPEVTEETRGLLADIRERNARDEANLKGYRLAILTGMVFGKKMHQKPTCPPEEKARRRSLAKRQKESRKANR